MNKLLLVADNFRNTVLLECIYEWYPDKPLVYYMMTDCSIRVYRSFTTIFHKCMNIAINVFSGIMLNAFNDPLCSKLCWHNRWGRSSTVVTVPLRTTSHESISFSF